MAFFYRYFLSLSLMASLAVAWLPDSKHLLFQERSNFTFSPDNTTKLHRVRWTNPPKIRGVGLGAMFIFEPWMAETEWSSMGCSGLQSEFDCVSHLGQQQANTVFQNHWNTWVTQNDLQRMLNYGLNTVRIPVGYWMMEEIVLANENFPQGGLGYLERLCGWASDLGFYIIIDLHGAPGAQVPDNSDTGQYVSSAGFYSNRQYSRAEAFLSWLTTLIHTDHAFRNVGMVEILNEPSQSAPSSMFTDYYPSAYNAIRKAESVLGISTADSLNVQVMNPLWAQNNPIQSLEGAFSLTYDDHRYLKWDSSVGVSHFAYLSNSCHDFRGTSDGSGIPTIVGEFSISPPDSVQWTSEWNPSTQQHFYSTWFSAMVTTWESQTSGWIFWAWKADLGDWRWSYEDAVAAGVIPSNAGDVDRNVCSGY